MLKILRKMNVLLDGKQKRAMIALIIMMLVGGVLKVWAFPCWCPL